MLKIIIILVASYVNMVNTKSDIHSPQSEQHFTMQDVRHPFAEGVCLLRQMGKVCGIYKITSPTKKVYVGQSINIKKRWENYKSGYCKSQTKLYNSFCKYGTKNHRFEIIQECNPFELDDLEKYYIQSHQCFNSKYGLNLLSAASGKQIISDETRQKQSKARCGFKVSDATKEKLRKIRLKQKCPSPLRSVTDTKTGNIYPSMKEVAILLNIKYTTFKMMMYGKNPNRTSFKLTSNKKCK